MMHALTSLNDGRTNEIVLRITILSFLISEYGHH